MNYMIGVEREGLRINNDGMLADTPHPFEFEFRLSDIDPFDLCGISRYELELIVAILFMYLVKDGDDIPDDPSGILIECAEVNRSLQLGVEKGINYYIKREKTGIRKSDLVRTLIKESGFEGLLKLAIEYGMKYGAEETGRV